jgi:hypothetical protein
MGGRRIFAPLLRGGLGCWGVRFRGSTLRAAGDAGRLAEREHSEKRFRREACVAATLPLAAIRAELIREAMSIAELVRQRRRTERLWS